MKVWLLLLLRTRPPHREAWGNLLETAWLTASTYQTYE